MREELLTPLLDDTPLRVSDVNYKAPAAPVASLIGTLDAPMVKSS